MATFLYIFALLSSSIFYVSAQTVFISVGDVSLTSSITGNELVILLTKEAFTCSASLEFFDIDDNQTISDADTLHLLLGTVNTTLYYRVTVNDATVGTGSISIEDDIPSSMESIEVSVDKTGTNEISLHVSFDESVTIGADDTYTSSGSAEIYTITGFTTMVPLIFVIFFALALKNVYVSLYLAIWIGSFIITGCSFRYAFERSLDTYILQSAANEEHQFVIIFTVFLSGLVFLIQRSGGTDGFTALVSKLAKTNKATQFATFLAGLVFFFDDYANALVVGATFQPLTDMFHISREKLAFLVDATSAPDASIWPLSSWVGFELQQIQEQLDLIKRNNGGIMPEGLTDNAFVFFVITIPTRFYPIYMLVFQVIIMSLAIEFGPMLVAERLVRVNKRTDGGRGKEKRRSNDDNELQSGAEPDKDTPGRWWNMVVPILTLVILLLAVLINTGSEGVEADGVEPTARNIFAYSDPWGSLLYGTFGASLFTIAFFMVQFKYNGSIVPPSILACKYSLFKSKDTDDDKDIAKPLITFPEAIETWIQGIAFMAPAVCILVLVWGIGAIMTDIGADRYFARIIYDAVNPKMLPTLVFILAALISAATGTSWGTMTIMFPLVSPAAWAICEPLDNGVFLFTATLSQILSGAIFGDHASPLSDTTLLSSVASHCDLFRHVWTQMPYAIWVAFFSVITGTLMIGDGISSGVCIFVGVIVLLLCTWLVGAPVISKSGRYDIFMEMYIYFLRKCKKTKEDKAEEKELDLLKRKTITLVRDEEIRDDPDWLMKLLNLMGLCLVESDVTYDAVHVPQVSGKGDTAQVQEEDETGRNKEDDYL